MDWLFEAIRDRIADGLLTAFLIALGYLLSQIVAGRAFWKLNPSEGVLVAISLPEHNQAEYTHYIPLGDALAYSDITTLFTRRYWYRSLEFDIYRNPQHALDNWSQNLVLIGGGRDNLTTRCFLGTLDPPLYGRDHELPVGFDFKGHKARDGRVIRTPRIRKLADGSDVLEEDLALIIRAPDPFNPKQYVFVLDGCYTTGTYGAVRWLSQRRNLWWLWAWIIGRRMLEFLFPRHWPKSDSIEIVLTVEVLPSIDETALPQIGSIKLWSESEHSQASQMRTVSEGYWLAKPYFFKSPGNYNYLAEYLYRVRTPYPPSGGKTAES